VAKSDPKNRAAREELAKVKEALKVKKQEEKERMKGLFGGKSMYEVAIRTPAEGVEGVGHSWTKSSHLMQDKEKAAKVKARAEADKKKHEASTST
jgi:hypothetical protein